MLQGRGKESDMADPGRGHLGQGGAGSDLLRTPDGNLGSGDRGCQGPFLPGWVGPLDQQPLWWDGGGWGRLDPQHLRVGAEVKVLPGDQQRPGSQGREGRHGGRERTSG